MGKFLARESGMELGKVSVLANSCHLGEMNQEIKKTKELLQKLGK
jgi:hypothetical protein